MVTSKLLRLVPTKDVLYMLAYPVVCVGHAQILEWISFKASEVLVLLAGFTTNTCICAARLISSSRSLSVELLVCWPDPRKQLILWSILLAIDTVALSAKEIRYTAFSVTFGPRFLILVLLYRLLCSTSKSCAMLFPLPHLLLTDRFQINLSQSLRGNRELMQNDWYRHSNEYLLLWWPSALQ